MNQIIPTPLAIIFIAVFAWGVGFFLTKFNERVTAEINQSNAATQDMIENLNFEARKTRRESPPLTNPHK